MSDKESKELTREKVQVYEIVFTMFIKLLLVLAGLVAFFIVLYFMLKMKTNEEKLIFGVFDIILGGTIFLVYKHYFPEKKK